jgi:hypothetical protein
LFGDFAAEDDGNLAGLGDSAVGIEQTLAQLIERGSPMKDQLSQNSTARRTADAGSPLVCALVR